MALGRLSGLGAWMVQRVSAVYIVIFLACFSIAALGGEGGYAAWHNLMARPPVALSAMLFFVAVLFHAWVGMRDVVLDYVHPVGARLLLLIALGGWLSALVFWAAWILLQVVGS